MKSIQMIQGKVTDLSLDFKINFKIEFSHTMLFQRNLIDKSIQHSKMMKNAFHFILKALFFLKIFKLLS